MKKNLILWLLCLLILSCKEGSETIHIPAPKKPPFLSKGLKLSETEKYDKLLGPW